MTNSNPLSFQAKIRLRNNGQSPASWHFITIPSEITALIETLKPVLPKRGRGSIKVQARIGYCTRETSIFPDKKSSSYLLPIKASVRKELHIKDSDIIGVELILI